MRELPEPYGYFDIRGSAADGFTRDQVLAIQRQAYEDGLRDAGKDAERYQWLKNDCNDKGTTGTYIAKELFGFEWDRAIDAAMLTASQKEPK